MPEIIHSEQLDRPTHGPRQFKLLDIVLFVVIGVVIVVLALTLIGKLRLRNEVAGAKTVADKVVAYIPKQQAADIRKLGSSNFQKAFSEQTLASALTGVHSKTTGQPTIEKQIVSNDTKAQNVVFVYKYGGKTPYYFRITVSKPAGDSTWKLIGLSGNDKLSELVKN